MPDVLDLTTDSKYQEQIVEYKFVSELMISLAYFNKKLEVLRVHSDSFGYDLILKVDDVIKYVQLKSRIKTGSAQYWDIHKSLLTNPNGMLLVIYYMLDNANLFLEYNYLNPAKYQSTLLNPPKQRKDTTKYCRANIKDLVKVNSIDGVARLFL